MNGACWMVVVACAIDRSVGDPRRWLHPVQLMGLAINGLRTIAERWAGDQPWRLRWAGGAISLILLGGSGLAGWAIERVAQTFPGPGLPILAIGLASALAGRSLEQAVRAVLEALPDLPQARERLSWIVGRSVDDLPEAELLRAAAETASENAVDGLFAPLFWMMLGAWIWECWPELPGPLALAWGFKAASTLDSMLGYRSGRLRWLGTAGARLDDVLTWWPCRLTALTLPLASGDWQRCWLRFQASCRDGGEDPSPNAGVSQAAFAHAVGVRLGGVNRYGNECRVKPFLAAQNPGVDADAVERMLGLSLRLEGLWLLIYICGCVGAAKYLSGN